MGLLDWAQTPQGIGLLSAAAGAMAGARRGRPWNTAGIGLSTGIGGYQQAIDMQRQDAERKRQEMQQEQTKNALMNAYKAGIVKRKTETPAQYKAGGQTFGTMQEAEQYARAFDPRQELGAALYGEFGGKEPLANNIDFSQYAGAPFVAPDLNPMMGIDTVPGTVQEVEDGYDPRKAAIAMLESGNVDAMAKGWDLLSQAQKQDSKTAEMKNWEYGMALPEDQRQQFFARAGAGASPSAVQEWEFFNRLDPQQQALYLEMKRNPQIMNLGGAMAVRSPGGGIGESYAVTPKPEDMPSFRGAQAAAVEGAKTDVQIAAESVNKGKKADSLIANIDEAERILKARKATGSLIGAGVAAGKGALGFSDASTRANQQLELIAGWMVSNVPRMEGPQSNYDVQNYRVMAATVGDKTKPIDDRLAALRVLRQLQEKYKSINSGQSARPPIDSLWGK